MNQVKQRRERILRQLRESSTVEEEIKNRSSTSLHEIESVGNDEDEYKQQRNDWNDVPANH